MQVTIKSLHKLSSKADSYLNFSNLLYIVDKLFSLLITYFEQFCHGTMLHQTSLGLVQSKPWQSDPSHPEELWTVRAKLLRQMLPEYLQPQIPAFCLQKHVTISKAMLIIVVLKIKVNALISADNHCASEVYEIWLWWILLLLLL